MWVASICTGVILQVLMIAALANGQNFDGMGNPFGQPPQTLQTDFTQPGVRQPNAPFGGASPGDMFQNIQGSKPQPFNTQQHSNFGSPPENAGLRRHQTFPPASPTYSDYQGPDSFGYQNSGPMNTHYSSNQSPRRNTNFWPSSSQHQSSSFHSSPQTNSQFDGPQPMHSSFGGPTQMHSASAPSRQMNWPPAPPKQTNPPPAPPPETNPAPAAYPPTKRRPSSNYPRRYPPPRPNSSRYSRPPPPPSFRRQSQPEQPTEEDPLKGHCITCIFNVVRFYVTDFRPSMIDPFLCSHINYEFASLDQDTYEVVPSQPDLDIDRGFYKEMNDLKKKNPNLKIIISVGGWDDSTKKYSEMARDDALRKKFAKTAVEFIHKYNFDGMDLAWEYPNCWQGATGVYPQDKDNFTALLKEIKDALDASGGLLFTISVSALKKEMEAAYDIPTISGLVDHINVMTYDMHGPWESVTGHHQQFKKCPNDADPYCNVQAAMNLWVDKGAAKEKLNMGLALYAKTFTLADPNNCGMGAPATGPGNPGPISDDGGFLLYSEICLFIIKEGWIEKQDENAGCYAYSGDQWACYDPPGMVVNKTQYAIQSGYKGLLMKDMGDDDFRGTCFNITFPLIRIAVLAMEQAVKHPS